VFVCSALVSFRWFFRPLTHSCVLINLTDTLTVVTDADSGEVAHFKILTADGKFMPELPEFQQIDQKVPQGEIPFFWEYRRIIANPGVLTYNL